MASQEHPNHIQLLKYRPHRGKAVQVKITFSSAPSKNERLYGLVTDGPVPDRWLAKKIPPIDAWVLDVRAEDHQVLSCKREGNLLHVVSKGDVLGNDQGWHLPEPPKGPEGVVEVMAPDDRGPDENLDSDDLQDDLDRDWFARQHRIQKLLDPCFAEKILVWNGHFKDGEYFYAPGGWSTPEQRLRSVFRDRFSLTLRAEDIRQMEEAAITGALLHPPLEFRGRASEFACPFCGESIKFGYDGKRLLILNKPCPHPNGLVTEWELNVPSGKLVVANNLRQWFPCSEEYDINKLIGCHLTTLSAAKVGMSYGFVGNTCPSVYREGDKFVIGSYSDEVWNEETEDYDPNPEACPWGERVAGVCTDLWWYSIVDYDELQRRIAHYTPDTKPDRQLDVVDVRPGVYHFRQEAGVDRDGPLTEYATFEWVRDPDPLVDYLGQEKTKWLGALDVLIESCLSWPTLYMGLGYTGEDAEIDKNRPALIQRWQSYSRERKIDCLARAADHFMCVLGGGVEWHENGFPRTVVSQEAKRLAEEFNVEGIVPSFGEKRRHWYPICDRYGGLVAGAGLPTRNESINLNTSFVLLGLNICQNAIKGGETPRLNHDVWPPAFEIPWCRERLALFGKCYLGLRKRYPNLVFDEKFDAWMNEVDFKKYVEEYDFGPTNPPQDHWGDAPKTIKRGDYFEFDARKLQEGASFCWHPKIMGGANAHKKDAHRFHIDILEETVSPLGHLHHAYLPGRANIPLWVVGRVIRGTGEGYNSKELEVAFDYGTPDMTSKRWSIRESNVSALRQFNDPTEYQDLLEKCKTYFDEVEAEVDAKLAKDKAAVEKALAKKKKTPAKKTAKKTASKKG